MRRAVVPLLLVGMLLCVAACGKKHGVKHPHDHGRKHEAPKSPPPPARHGAPKHDNAHKHDPPKHHDAGAAVAAQPTPGPEADAGAPPPSDEVFNP
jgi:hypothetical protein